MSSSSNKKKRKKENNEFDLTNAMIEVKALNVTLFRFGFAFSGVNDQDLRDVPLNTQRNISEAYR